MGPQRPQFSKKKKKKRGIQNTLLSYRQQSTNFSTKFKTKISQ